MSYLSISKGRFASLKRTATRLKRTDGILHSEALDRVAHGEGFGNWSQLAKHIEVADEGEVPTKPYSLRISGFVRGASQGESMFWHEYIKAMNPQSWYSKFKWIPRLWDAVGQTKDKVREYIATARRAVEFMDATGLRPSSAHTRVFGSYEDQKGFDHTCVWLDRENRYVVTTEPYTGAAEKLSKLVDWCQTNQWELAFLPNKIGIWNPCQPSCKPDCSAHTRLAILAPPKKGGDVQAIRKAIQG